VNDLFNINTEELREKKLFLFDMDGTIYNEEQLFEGALELLNYIRNIGGQYIFITNNSSKSVEDYITKLDKMGIPVAKDNFFTSSQATSLFLLDNFKDKKVFCMGTQSLIKELQYDGIDVTDNKTEKIDVVVVGFDTEITSQKIYNTCELLYKGIPFIATNPDRACPVSFGFIPDCGAICEMLYLATNRSPIYIGKPNAIMVDYVMKNSQYLKEQIVVIGDRLYTDIALGINAGVSTICVLTGEATLEELKTSMIRPDFVFQSVKEIVQALI